MSNRRRYPRQTVSYPAWIELARGRRIQCALSNASEKGALLLLSSAEIVPRRFILWLTANGTSQRACLVVWQDGPKIGVEYVGRRTGEAVILD